MKIECTPEELKEMLSPTTTRRELENLGIEITYEDFAEMMKEYISRRDYNKRPTREFVNSMRVAHGLKPQVESDGNVAQDH